MSQSVESRTRIKNERYILVSENVSFKDFAINVAKNINVKPPQKEASTLLLNIGWRLDWLSYFFKRKYRKLTKQMVKSITTDSYYSNEKVFKDLPNFRFKTIENSTASTSVYFLKDLR